MFTLLLRGSRAVQLVLSSDGQPSTPPGAILDFPSVWTGHTPSSSDVSGFTYRRFVICIGSTSISVKRSLELSRLRRRKILTIL